MTLEEVEKARKLVKELWISKYASIRVQTSRSVDFGGVSNKSAIAKVSKIKRTSPLNELTYIGGEAFPASRAYPEP